MSTPKHILYISYDGMTDPLGQSQVLPYIIGLTKLNHRFTLLSFEKKERFADGKALIESICEKHAIDWQPMMYTKKPPILSTLWDVFRMKRKIRQVHKANPIDICHCRSHISSMGGRMLQQQKGIPFLFDMRGFYADERVDGGLWNLKNPIFKMVYTFFKKKEKDFLQNAFCSISLTQAGADIMHSWKGFENTNIQVIPCCADLDHFDGSKVDKKDIEQWRDKLGISPEQFVVSYLGSLGTWYMADEMFAFFKQLKTKYPNALFLFITPDRKQIIESYATKHQIDEKSLRVIKASRAEVPIIAKLSSISLFFIKPVFSKKASSPVKMGELLALGVPIVANRGVGDVDLIIEDTNCGILVDDFSQESYEKAILEIDAFIQKPSLVFTQAAEKYYSLKKGIDLYQKVYNEV